jgi:plastocyanin
MKLVRMVAAFSLVGVSLLGCGDDEPTVVTPTTANPSPSPSPTPTPTPTPTPSASPAPTPSASPSPTPAPAAQTVTVMVGPGGTFTFAPQTVNIHVGDTVHWVWVSSSIPHTVTSGTAPTADGKFCSLPAGQTPSAAACGTAAYAKTAPNTHDETFSTAGSFPYFCEVHGVAMTGMVVVQ